MKKLIVVAIIIAGFFPQFLMAQETEAIRQVLQDNYTVLSIYQKGSSPVPLSRNRMEKKSRST